MGAPPLIYRLKNDFQELSRLMDAVEQYSLIQRLDSRTTYALKLAVEEIITNTILYGYESDRAHEIEVRVTVEDDELILEITDDARPFNPLRVPAPAMAMAGGGESESMETPASLGLFLVREVMDDLEYRPQPHGNMLVMRKRLGRSPSMGRS